MFTASPKSVLDEILDPLTECFTPEVARRITAISLDPRNQARIDELASKANEGQLSESERADYEAYIEALDLLAIVKAKARFALANGVTGSCISRGRSA
jgi:hypothetical protein